MDTTQTTNDSLIDSILDRVRMPEHGSDDDLTPALRTVGEDAARRAFFTARADGEPVDTAKAKAKVAFETAVLGKLPTKPAPAPAPRTAKDALLGHLDDVLGPANAVTAAAPANVSPAASSVPPKDTGLVIGDVSVAGKARSERDRDALIATGFSPRETVYARGTRVNSTGVENATRSRVEHDAKPRIAEYCGAFQERIAAERRRIEVVKALDVEMHGDGQLRWSDTRPTAPPTFGALAGLVSKLGYGGAGYLTKCTPELRAHNVNEWRKELLMREAIAMEAARARLIKEKGTDRDFAWERAELALRLRDRATDAREEVFGVVTPTYTPFDCDKVAEALARAAAGDSRADGARGTVTYDGERARFEVMFHSDIRPSDYVAGEFFKAGVVITANDIGGGSVKVSAAAWQNLCLNLIIIDRAARAIASLRHVGSVLELTKKFEKAFRDALDAINHFLVVWGYAVHEDVATRIRQATGEPLPGQAKDVVAGVFRGILDDELIPVPGRTEKIVEKLVAAWEADESAAKLHHHGVTRAAIVNAFTRFAHTELDNEEDPWAEDEIQRAAGAMLWGTNGRDPKPLPFAPEPEKAAPRRATATA